MKLVSTISFGKTITVVTAILVPSFCRLSILSWKLKYMLKNNSIEFPLESITKILNFVNKANAALAEGDLELVSRSLGEIETEIRDQLSEINVPLNVPHMPYILSFF